MAFNPTQNWYVFAAGNELNGGGFDPAYGGTNYANAASAILSLTDFDASGTTNLHSATGGFSAITGLAGNTVRLSGQGYRRITAVVDDNNLTCDAAWGTFSGVSGRVGGAWADWRNFASAGSGLPAPLLATPVIAGNHIYIDGGGLTEPTYAQVLFDFSAGYWTIPGPSGISGYGTITIEGINGNFGWKIGNHGMVFNVGYNGSSGSGNILLKNSRLFLTTNTASSPGADALTYISCENVIVDTRGYAGTYYGIFVYGVSYKKCGVKNSGSVSAGANGTWGFDCAAGGNIESCFVKDYNEGGFSLSYSGTAVRASARNCVAENCNGYGFRVACNSVFSPGQMMEVINCVVNNTRNGPGVWLYTALGASDIDVKILNCSITNNATYGITGHSNAKACDAYITQWGNNNVYGNTSGNYDGFTAKPGDLSINPEYKNVAAFDWTGGVGLKGVGVGLMSNNTDIGIQRVEESTAITPFLGGLAARRS